MSLRWDFKRFDELRVHELYELLQLRTEVFTVEQNCVFQDLDGADDKAYHLLGYEDNVLVAYTRNFDAGIKFKEASIGRVVTRMTVRRKGYGHVLMRESIVRTYEAFGRQPIRIGAQQRLTPFYEQHGFVIASAMYFEDDIPHVEMLLT